MNKEDGTKKQASRQEKRTARKRVEAVDPFSTGTQESTNAQSSGVGIQRPDGNDSGFGGWGHRSEHYDKPVDANPGKVLEHLGNLESRFYGYVHAHQERLDARRKESEKAELEFQQEAQELRGKLLALLGQHEDDVSSSPPESDDSDAINNEKP